MTIIECPKCEWHPDGEIYWRCSCGHRWDTFQTKGRCPNCNNQWIETYCPGCGHMSPHKDWYIDPSKKPIDPPIVAERRLKKYKLEKRLTSLGITKYRIAHLPYVDHYPDEFRSATEAGCRMIILAFISNVAMFPEDKDIIIDWFKGTHLWNKVSPKEKEFLEATAPDNDAIQNMAWHVEGAFVLGWCLNLFDELPPVDREATDEEMSLFMNSLPLVGDPVANYIFDLRFRPLEEIHEENLLNEIITTFLRDLMIENQPYPENINVGVSYERHLTLNWLRRFTPDEWDDTDTST